MWVRVRTPLWWAEVKKGKEKKRRSGKKLYGDQTPGELSRSECHLSVWGLSRVTDINTLAVVGERTQGHRGSDDFYVKKLPCGRSRIRTCDRSVYSTFHVELTDAFTYRAYYPLKVTWRSNSGFTFRLHWLIIMPYIRPRPLSTLPTPPDFKLKKKKSVTTHGE